MATYNPSSAGFLVNGLAVTKYDSGCLRSILARKNGARSSIPKLFEELGDIHERLCLEFLQSNKETTTEITREEVLKEPALAYTKHGFSGRQDFVLRPKDLDPIIVECKGTISKSNRLKVIRKGELNPTHLAQLIAYMVQRQLTSGMLIVGYYEIDPDNGELWCPHAFRDMNTDNANFRVFNISIGEDGTIFVDNQPYLYSVIQNIQHRNASLEVLADKKISDRPFNSMEEYTSPCRFCTFKEACDQYDVAVLEGKPWTADQFIDYCKQLVVNEIVLQPKIFTPKRRPK